MNKASPAYGYVFAVLSVLAALAISTVLFDRFPSYHQHGIFTWFLLAVAFVSWRQGFWPGLAAMLLSAFFVTWYFIPPAHSLAIPNGQDVFRVVQFFVLATLINVLQNSRARAEQSLKATEQRLSFALRSAEIAVWDADMANNTFWHSDNLAAVCGIIGSFANTYDGYFAYVHPDDREAFRNLVASPGNRRRNFEIDHRIVNETGQTRHVTTRGVIRLDNQGNVVRVVATVLAIDRAWLSLPNPLDEQISAQSHLLGQVARDSDGDVDSSSASGRTLIA